MPQLSGRLAIFLAPPPTAWRQDNYIELLPVALLPNKKKTCLPRRKPEPAPKPNLILTPSREIVVSPRVLSFRSRPLEGKRPKRQENS